ncbi:MAG: TolC family protein [Planctomycetaceae bacterium]|nr:TolC family protein [Planctomycetaceae bacterium]
MTSSGVVQPAAGAETAVSVPGNPTVIPVRMQVGLQGVQPPPLGGPGRSTFAPPVSPAMPPTRIDVPGSRLPTPGILPPSSQILIPQGREPSRRLPEQQLPELAPETVGPGAGPGVWTLDELSELAMNQNPAIREAWAQIRSARGAAIQAGLYPNPTVNASSPQLAGSDSQYNAFLTQEFVTKGKLRLSRSAAMRAAQQAELQYVRRRFDILTTVRAQFYSALIAQQRVEVLKNLVVIANASRESADKLERVGEGTRTDSLLLKIEQDRAEIALENGNTLLAAAYQQLATAVGEPNLSITAVRGDVTLVLPDYEYQALQAGVVTQNALAQVAQLEISRSRILLQRAIVEPFPNVIAMGGYQRQVNDAPVLNQGLFQVTMPFPLWNRNQGNIASAQANVTAAAGQLGRVQNELSQRAAQALAEYRTAGQLVDRYEKEILPRANELLKIAQQGYAAGQFDFLRLLQAQRVLLETNLTYVNAQESRWQAAAQIAGLLQIEQFP